MYIYAQKIYSILFLNSCRNLLQHRAKVKTQILQKQASEQKLKPEHGIFSHCIRRHLRGLCSRAT